jgi:proline-specific peptidase
MLTQEATAVFAVGGESFSTWYKVVGDLVGRSKRPLVIIHGGPSMGHDYLSPLADLAPERPIVFYDQIGCGRSSQATNKPATFWTIDLFLNQFMHLLQHLCISNDFDVLGHSIGTVLLSELLIRQSPAGLKRAVFSNPFCDTQEMLAVRMAQMLALPAWVVDTVKDGMNDTPECRRAFKAYTDEHFCRTSPTPPEFDRAVDAAFKNVHIWNSLYASSSVLVWCFS